MPEAGPLGNESRPFTGFDVRRRPVRRGLVQPVTGDPAAR